MALRHYLLFATAAAAALLAPAARAQDRPAPPPAATASESPVYVLFRQAHVAMAEVPAGLDLFEASQLAHFEAVAAAAHTFPPPEAIADTKQAFRDLAGLPAPSRDTEPFLEFAAERQHGMENGAIRDLVNLDDFDDALALAQSSHGSPFDRMLNFDEILTSTSFLGHTKGDPGKLPLVIQECLASTGEFPYQGAAHLLLSGLDPAEKTALVRQGYRQIEDEHDPNMIQFAALFLAQGHRVVPAQDPGYESALTALLAFVASLGDGGIAAQTGTQLLAMYAQALPDQAAEMDARYPRFSHPIPGILDMFNLGPKPRPAASGAGTPPPPPDPDAQLALALAFADRDRGIEFQLLVTLSGNTNPEVAFKAAGDALTLVNDDLVRTHTTSVLSLARNLVVSRHDDADALLARVLAGVQKTLADKARAIRAADGTQRAQLLRYAPGLGNSAVDDVQNLTAAARVDFEFTRRAVLPMEVDFFTPLALAAVAAGAPAAP